MITSGISLGKRLTLSFTIIIAFMASLAVLSSIRIAGLNTEIGLIVNDRYPETNIANRVKAQINEIFRGMLGIVIMTKLTHMDVVVHKNAADAAVSTPTMNSKAGNLSKAISGVKLGLQW